ncbi:hypothetical protein [Bartonella fuyuanensis]
MREFYYSSYKNMREMAWITGVLFISS